MVPQERVEVVVWQPFLRVNRNKHSTDGCERGLQHQAIDVEISCRSVQIQRRFRLTACSVLYLCGYRISSNASTKALAPQHHF